MTYNYQYDLHNLRWGWGDYEFMEALRDIANKFRRGTVYMKGAEKCAYISSLFPTATFIDLVDIAFKHLNNCIHERCDVKRGKPLPEEKFTNSNIQLIIIKMMKFLFLVIDT